jgi:acetyl-CoA C-acetyltransferase
MGSHGIRDRVAIVGMGCTRFAEHWDKGADELLVEATDAALASVAAGGGDGGPGAGRASFGHDEVDAYWLGTAQSGMSGMVLAKPLQLEGKPVTRVENMCATGSEALRQAAYAVASGAYDVAMAVGVEKVKDSGYQGLNAFPIPTDGTNRTLTAAAMFSMVAPAYARRYGVEPDELRRVLARIASKNHHNGARNERAQFRREMSVEAICAMPAVAGDLSVFDCAGVADGAAAAVVVRAEDAHRYTDRPLYVKALALVAGNGSGLTDPAYDYTTFPEVARSAADAYAQAGVTDPRSELAMAEVHDCFTPTELVLLEDLDFAERGTAWRQVLDGAFDLDGDLPVNPDGGLKSFGHPVGASGLRMLFEAWLQLRGEAPDERRIATTADRSLALTHNLGGYPGEMVSFVSIVGTEPSA